MKKHKGLLLFFVVMIIILTVSLTSCSTNPDKTSVEKKDLSVYLGGSFEDIKADFPDIVEGDFESNYCNDIFSVNVDEDGNILSISLEDDGTESLLGVRCGMSETEVEAAFTENGVDENGYCAKLDADVNILYDESHVTVVELWLRQAFHFGLNNYIGSNEKNLFSDFKGLVQDKNNSDRYYDDSLTFVFDEKGFVSEIGIAGETEESIYNLTYGAKSETVDSALCEYGFEQKDGIYYCADKDEYITVETDAQGEYVTSVRLWIEPDYSYYDQGQELSYWLNYYCEDFLDEYVDYRKVVLNSDDRGKYYYHDGICFILNEDGYICKVSMKEGSNNNIYGITVGMTRDDVCSSFDDEEFFYVNSDGSISINFYYIGICLSVSFSDDNKVDLVRCSDQNFEIYYYLGSSLADIRQNFPDAKLTDEGYYENEYFIFVPDENDQIIKATVKDYCCASIYGVFVTDTIDSAKETLTEQGFTVTESDENQLLLINGKGETISILLEEDKYVGMISVY